ncbi:MAG: hypothetical protein AAGA85_01675 [Bacteroidota bacterium]
MIQENLEVEILEKVKGLNASQRYHVLDYIDRIPHTPSRNQRYRRKALRQIREALANQ